MRYPINSFAQLCERVELNDWSFGYDYPPFIESPIRNEINRIGLKRLLEDMRRLENEFDRLPHWERIAQFILEEAQQVTYALHDLQHPNNAYPIMERISEIREYNHRLYEERIQKEKAIQAEIAKRKADRLAEKNRIQEHRNELKESFKQVIDDFNTKNLTGKLEVITLDVKRNPDAYPLDLFNIDLEKWQAINPDLRHSLIERLLLLKDKQYKPLIERLSRVSSYI